MTRTRLENRIRCAFGVSAGIGVMVVCGITAGDTQAAAVQSAGPSVVAAPAVAPVVSVRDLMVAVVGHAANELWSVEQEGHAPKTDEEWQKVEHHAIQLAASGTLTALGGTGHADNAWASRPEWKQYSQQMSEVGLAAFEAARRKDLDALVTVNGRIGDVCQSCHQAMMP